MVQAREKGAFLKGESSLGGGNMDMAGDSHPAYVHVPLAGPRIEPRETRGDKVTRSVTRSVTGHICGYFGVLLIR